jgi:hypothetical protein
MGSDHELFDQDMSLLPTALGTGTIKPGHKKLSQSLIVRVTSLFIAQARMATNRPAFLGQDSTAPDPQKPPKRLRNGLGEESETLQALAATPQFTELTKRDVTRNGNIIYRFNPKSSKAQAVCSALKAPKARMEELTIAMNYLETVQKHIPRLSHWSRRTKWLLVWHLFPYLKYLEYYADHNVFEWQQRTPWDLPADQCPSFPVEPPGFVSVRVTIGIGPMARVKDVHLFELPGVQPTQIVQAAEMVDQFWQAELPEFDREFWLSGGLGNDGGLFSNPWGI